MQDRAKETLEQKGIKRCEAGALVILLEGSIENSGRLAGRVGIFVRLLMDKAKDKKCRILLQRQKWFYQSLFQ